MTKSDKSARAPVQISQETKDRLKVLAAFRGMKMAQLVEELIEAEIAKYDIPGLGVRLRSVK
ncbi:MAG: hypothetical protein J0L91_00040 [Burkholderiales bacterium]|nr:hypothetical protein [Burkholderiales bacterium]